MGPQHRAPAHPSRGGLPHPSPEQSARTAEEKVIDAATWVADHTTAYPGLNAAVAALRASRDGLTMADLLSKIRELSPRAAAVLARQGWTLNHFLYRATAADIQDARSVSWRTWALWVLATGHFGWTPTWLATWPAGMRHALIEQVDFERHLRGLPAVPDPRLAPLAEPHLRYPARLLDAVNTALAAGAAGHDTAHAVLDALHRENALNPAINTHPAREAAPSTTPTPTAPAGNPANGPRTA